MTDAPTPTRRKSSIIVGRNAASNEKQGDKPTCKRCLHRPGSCDMLSFVAEQNRPWRFSPSIGKEIVNMPSPSEIPGEKQRAAVLELAGKWVDSRPLEETIADIDGARTPGREIEPLKKADCDGVASLSMTRMC